ncbi:MAG: serine hydrolase [Pseudomonadota bacterium]
MNRRQILHGLAASAGGALVPASLSAGPAARQQPQDGFLRASPADVNVDARAVLNFIDTVFASDLDLHSFMLYRHGRVVGEGWSWPYARERPHVMHSLTKSVTASGVGLAIDRGHFALHDPVVSFFADELTHTVDENLAAMTVRDLLTMQSGHAVSVSGSVFRPIKTSWVTEFFKIPVPHRPGSHFLYSSAVSFMLSAIVSKTTGMSLRDYLKTHLFEAMEITDLTWGSSPNGISSGGNGLTWKTEDALKLGVLHLHRGRWQGRQLLSPGWVDAATSLQVPGHNYGYQWWVDESVPAYSAIGAFGQHVIVFPEHDAVLALTAGMPLDSAFDEIIYKHFPRAFGDAGYKPPMQQVDELKQRTARMRLLPVARRTESPTSERVSGRLYTIEPNSDYVSEIQIEFNDDEAVFVQRDQRGEHRVRMGLSAWLESDTSITGAKLHHQYQPDIMRVVAHGYWWDKSTFAMTWQFVETAWVDTVVCRFHAQHISIDRRTNANYAPTVAPTLRGTMHA